MPWIAAETMNLFRWVISESRIIHGAFDVRQFTPFDAGLCFSYCKFPLKHLDIFPPKKGKYLFWNHLSLENVNRKAFKSSKCHVFAILYFIDACRLASYHNVAWGISQELYTRFGLDTLLRLATNSYVIAVNRPQWMWVILLIHAWIKVSTMVVKWAPGG